MNSNSSFTLISGIVAFVLVFVLFVVILMTQSFAPASSTSNSKSVQKTPASQATKVEKKAPKTSKGAAVEQTVAVGTGEVNQSVTIKKK